MNWAQYAEARPSCDPVSWYTASRFLVKAAALYLIPALLVAIFVWLLSFLHRKLR